MLLAETKELMAPQTLTGLVAAHDQARRLMSEGVQMINQAAQILGEAFGCSHLAGVLPHDCRGYDLEGSSATRTIEQGQALISRNGWNYVLKQSGVDALLTAKRKEQFQKSLENGEAPVFTVGNIISLLGGLAQDSDGYFSEAVLEAWDWLKPWGWSREHYKTNQKSEYEIASKVIKGGIANPGWGDRCSFSVGHYRRDNLMDMDKVFHLLDGKGVPRYPADLVSTMQTAMAAGQDQCTTPYFRIKWFKNGNGHIEFLRLDLLQKFNGIAGKGLLKREEAA